MNGENNATIAGVIIIGGATIWLVSKIVVKRWFWILVFGIGGLASAFSVLASIFAFQILGALGFTLLTVICWIALSFLWLAEYRASLK